MAEVWTTWTARYTVLDEDAFRDPARVDRHYGLPGFDRIYSLSLNRDGKSNVHESGKKFRTSYLGNYLAYRHIRGLAPNAWLWDERYRFEGEPTDSEMLFAQRDFARKFGEAKMELIRREAHLAGLNPSGKTEGRPDLAVFFPDAPTPWRFIEIKLPGDSLKPRQERWLRLFAKFRGPDASVVLEFKKR